MAATDDAKPTFGLIIADAGRTVDLVMGVLDPDKVEEAVDGFIKPLRERELVNTVKKRILNLKQLLTSYKGLGSGGSGGGCGSASSGSGRHCICFDDSARLYQPK